MNICLTGRVFLYYTHGGDHTHSKCGDLIWSLGFRLHIFVWVPDHTFLSRFQATHFCLGSRPHIFVSVPDHTFLSQFQTAHFCLIYLKWGVWSCRECPLSFPACWKCISLLVVSNVEASSSSLHTPLSLSLQVVRMNPYAALCSHMLSEAIDKLRRGEQTWPPLCV